MIPTLLVTDWFEVEELFVENALETLYSEIFQ